MRTVLLVVALGACGFSGKGTAIDLDASTIDAGVDAPTDPDATDAPMIDMAIDAPMTTATCYGSGPFTVCPRNMPTGSFNWANMPIDSGGPMCVPLTGANANAVCVIAASTINLGAGTIRITGAKPIVFLATSTINMDAATVIDVASHSASGASIGAGANSSSCSMPGMATDGGSGGGGAGGSFGTKGGDGAQNDGGGKGVAGGTQPAATLRGGCRGGDGAGTNGGAGGNGGGAIALIAVNNISFMGSVNASGGAGKGAAISDDGGGGGGSGGMIILDAKVVTGTGKAFANGGGGGEGSGSTAGATGNSGFEPSAGVYKHVSGGSGGTVNGGDGGHGNNDGTTGDVGIAGNSSGGGAGGGGGGAGVIWLLGGATWNGTKSPLPTPP